MKEVTPSAEAGIPFYGFSRVYRCLLFVYVYCLIVCHKHGGHDLVFSRYLGVCRMSLYSQAS